MSHLIKSINPAWRYSPALTTVISEQLSLIEAEEPDATGGARQVSVAIRNARRDVSPVPRRLAVVVNRIGFTLVWDRRSASGCSPPRLATTQLPPTALPLLVSG